MSLFSWRDNTSKSGTKSTFTNLYRHFRRVLALNNQILEMIADLERASGGEYIFDQAFLKSSVAGIIEKGRQSIYHLNTLAEDRYTALYEKFTHTSDQLTDILAGGPGPFGGQLVLAGNFLHRDLVHLAGGKGANLGEAMNGLKLPTPPLFVVSVTGYRHFMEENGLFKKINAICGEVLDPVARAGQIHELFHTARLPADLARTINTEVGNLRKQAPANGRFAVRSSAVGEDGKRSFAGQFHTLLNVAARDVEAACLEVMASRFSERLLRYIDADAPAEEAPVAVVVQAMVNCRASGVLYTRDPNNPDQECMVVSAVAGSGEAVVSGLESGDRFVMDRQNPFRLRASDIKTAVLNTRELVIAQTSRQGGPLRRGSGIVSLPVLKQLAEFGHRLEKRFQWPQDIEWCVDSDDRIWILQARPLPLQTDADISRPDQLESALQQLPVLLDKRGHICQLGLACGPVVHVTENTPTETFPVGAVAVSRYATPRLAGIVERASAIVTDIGSPTGHLATIAREYRTPALFGTELGTTLLQEGVEVVVDVEERTIYGGRVDLPPSLRSFGGVEIMAANPEASLLRRLLRLISPLNLLDPDSPSFRMENCRTIHDFLRFCHERSVAELIRFHSSGRAVSGAAPLLKADMPIRIRLIDVGGGLSEPTTDSVLVSQVASLPFQSFLKGVLQKNAWDQEPAPLGARDFLSSLTKPLTMLTNPPSYAGENLAILAKNYCNLSLRLGYHFNIIDCYLSDAPDDNYIYFRFVGGFAEAGKRVRRAVLISQILASLHFKVEQKGDLVIGKAKMLERSHLENILAHLGELVAFTRQLDVRISDDTVMERLFEDFIQRISSQKFPGR
jgi:pyruvate,water dikinase